LSYWSRKTLESNKSAVAKLLFREFGSLSVIEFLAPNLWILPQKSNVTTELSCSPGVPRPMKNEFTRQPEPEHERTRLTHGCLPPCAWDTRGGRALLSASNPAGGGASMKMSICWPTYKGPLCSVKR